MDKYDILFLLDRISNLKDLLKNRKETYKKYLLIKKDWMIRKYYFLRTKKSAEYHKKRGNLPIHTGVEKILTLDRRQRYAWDLFKPIDEDRNAKSN